MRCSELITIPSWLPTGVLVIIMSIEVEVIIGVEVIILAWVGMISIPIKWYTQMVYVYGI